MPPVIPPRHLRALELLGQAKNVTDVLTTQQQSGVSHTPAGTISNAVVIGQGTLFKYPNPPTNKGAYTSGSGLEVISGGVPTIRAGLITWQPCEGVGGAEKKTTFAGIALLDAAGNVRTIFDTAGISTWTKEGVFNAWLYQFT